MRFNLYFLIFLCSFALCGSAGAVDAVAVDTLGNTTFTGNVTVTGTVTAAKLTDNSKAIASGSRLTAQSIPNSTYTIVDFNTVDVDTKSAVTTGSAWAFRAPSAGYYYVSFHIISRPNASRTFGRLLINGVSTKVSHNDSLASSGTGMPVLVDAVVQLVQNDSVQFDVYTIDGAFSLDAAGFVGGVPGPVTYFSIFKL